MENHGTNLSDRNTLRLLSQGLCFYLYFFGFQLTEFTINDLTELYLGSDMVNIIYSLGIGCTGLGFLSFSVLGKLLSTNLSRKLTTHIMGAIAILTSVLVVSATEPSVFTATSLLALFSFGYIGGAMHYTYSLSFHNSSYSGRMLGLAASLAVLSQFVVQNLLIVKYAYIASVVSVVILLIFFGSKLLFEKNTETKPSQSLVHNTNKKLAFSLILIVLLMSIVVGLIDGVVVNLHALKKVNVSSYGRFFYVIGLLLAGFVADIKHRKYLSLATICSMFLSTIATAFLINQSFYFLAVSTMYFYCGFYVVFLTIFFIDFAPTTKSPALWAGMGRVVRSFTIAGISIPVVELFNAVGSIALVVGSCILSTLLLLLMIYFNYILNNPMENETTSSGDQKLQSFIEKYDFTPREKEVLTLLLSTDDGVQEIADQLYISRRVLQRHIASIYEKTGAKSRVGLLQLYMGLAHM